MPTIDVNLPGRPYQILIESGSMSRLGGIVERVVGNRTATLAVDARIAATHGAAARASLEAAGYAVGVVEITAEESSKNLAAVGRLYDAMVAARVERGSPVVAVGGGVTGDLAGFAAATYLRGLPLVQVPTTLLAMVDASIGGKTGVNLPLPTGVSGKNLVGSFWQPAVVVVDPDLLQTLEPRHFRCGLSECVKYGLIADPELLALLADQRDAIGALDRPVLSDLIARCAGIKARIVEDDEREAGRRAVLNLGHTFAHAIEPIPELDLHHGEAVAIGICAALHCAVETGRFAAPEAQKVRDLLELSGLPTRLGRPLEVSRLMEAMAYDKKTAGGRLRLILPTAAGRAEIVDDVPSGAIEAAWVSVGAAG